MCLFFFFRWLYFENDGIEKCRLDGTDRQTIVDDHILANLYLGKVTINYFLIKTTICSGRVLFVSICTTSEWALL